jgi:hypothetical protein
LCAQKSGRGEPENSWICGCLGSKEDDWRRSRDYMLVAREAIYRAQEEIRGPRRRADVDGSNRWNFRHEATNSIKESNSYNYVDWVAKLLPSHSLSLGSRPRFLLSEIKIYRTSWIKRISKIYQKYRTKFKKNSKNL